jgi:hypothetical protein
LDQFSVVRGSLQEAGVPFDADISGPQLIPITTVKVNIPFFSRQCRWIEH